jgi:hypothetical protein
MTRLHAELMRSISHYRSQQQGSAPERVFLCGGSVSTPYMREFFQEKLQLPVAFFNPLRNVAVAETVPTEILAGYGIWKTTEDKVPMLVQRRFGQRTAFVWGVSLDGSPLKLTTSKVESGGKALDESEAVMVEASSGGRTWYLLANPKQKGVGINLSKTSLWETAFAFSVRTL